MEKYTEEPTLDLKYLDLLAEKYPNIQEASTEIINYQALLQLPKGTEHFMSDLHGEYEAFIHIMNNASGEIRKKVDSLYGKMLTSAERAQLSTLIYYPEEKLKEIKNNQEININEWYMITIHQLIEIAHLVSIKYSRNKVRKSLPPEYAFIINELINAENTSREEYYESIISTIIEIGKAEDFIVAFSTVIKRLIVDQLHIVGDIFDRGPRPDIIIDSLRAHHSVDIQWGNHDVLWMGAASGSAACIATVLSNSIKYGNLDTLETAYGINLRPLALFAQQQYKGSKRYELKSNDEIGNEDLRLLSKMYEAISVILFKLEGQIILRHPEYNMDDCLLLNHINRKKGTIWIAGKTYPIKINDLFPMDEENPYQLTSDEQSVLDQLFTTFKNSYRLQQHIRFLYSAGSMYLQCNNNLLFHGCIPMNPDGTFMNFCVNDVNYHGKSYFDYADKMARQAYYAPEGSKEKKDGRDFLWFLWRGRHSPLFGRDRITTFERLYVDDPEAWIEEDNAYYKLIEDPVICRKIFEEFGLDYETSHIINGHVPVNAIMGESPIKANGRIIVIDGGFCKAYQKKTGIAGYTLIYDSYGMRISSHEPFLGIKNAIENNSDIFSQEQVFETSDNRLTVADTDSGKDLIHKIEDLKNLMSAYQQGLIKERRGIPADNTTS